MYIASAAATSTSPQGLYKIPSPDAASWKETHFSFLITFGIAIVKRSFSVLFFPELLSFI